MALTNAQYGRLMQEYDAKRRKNREEQRRRRVMAEKAIPELSQVEEQITELFAAQARQALSGKTEAPELAAQREALAKQKKALLKEHGFPEDFLSLHYDCADCRDTGLRGGEYCSCFLQARIRILYDQAGIGKILKKENFSTLRYSIYDKKTVLPDCGTTQYDYMRSIVRHCKSFAAAFPAGKTNIFFTGGCGTGKTFLTNCIAAALLERGFSVLYLGAQDFFDVVSKESCSRDREDGEETSVMSCDMLIIDDLGTELNNTFVSSRLFSCVNKRMLENRGTIISSNLSLQRLKSEYSDRVASRIVNSYDIIPLYGGDLRGPST